MTRIGILGGTFDPIHLGHLAIGQFALEKMTLDKVIFVPCYASPLKDSKNITPDEFRLKMVQLAVKSNPLFEVSTFEVKRKQKSYTIDSLKHFAKIYEGSRLFFIIGADAFQDLDQWKDVEDILKLTDFIVFNRPGFEKKSRLKGRFHFVDMPALEISSSMLRQRVAQNKSIQYFVPNPVALYIEKKQLYKP